MEVWYYVKYLLHLVYIVFPYVITLLHEMRHFDRTHPNHLKLQAIKQQSET